VNARIAESDQDVTKAIEYLRDAKVIDLDGRCDSDIRDLRVALFELKQAAASGKLAPKEVTDFITFLLNPDYKGHLVAALQKRNGRVAAFHPVLTGLLGCNTAIYLLSSGQAAKSALFYILKYMTKDPTPPSCTLSLVHMARKTIELHPSLASNSGTTVRTAQHWLLRCMNQFNGCVILAYTSS